MRQKLIVLCRPRAVVIALATAWFLICWRLAGGADRLPTTAPVDHAIVRVDFAKDVVPILHDSCTSCHANGLAKGGLQMDTRDLLIKGGDSGDPAIVPGHSDKSLLIQLITETDPDVVMPKKGAHLNDVQIAVLKRWIDQGADWPAGVSPGRFAEADLKPRRPVMQAVPGISDPVDLLLLPYLQTHGSSLGKPVSDPVFARRVYLDTVGKIPTPDQLHAFEADSSPDKRDRLVQDLLSDNRRYAEHWLSFWNDLLRNDYQGTGYIDGGRKQITNWLFKALQSNMPYDQFVRELVTGANGSVGFINGIVWRGTVNASQTPSMQAAQNLSQVFMGINLKCASCHDSFVSNWKLADSYGLAGIFSDSPVEMQRCDVPQGKIAPLKFLYPQLGSIDTHASRAVRLQQLAAAITHPDNGRLTRTIVNRLWQRLIGRGLIEPTDDMDAAPWDADLLDGLAVDLSDHQFDLKQTLRIILTSQAYQMPCVAQATESTDHFVFAGPVVRRMSAEEFVDAISTVTGVWPAKAAVKLAGDGAPKAPEIRAAVCPASPLTTSLGRPNREQVVTERNSTATTLQGLEMTNGSTLAKMLEDGAARLTADPAVTTDQLIKQIYQRSLGREPTAAEAQTAHDIVGSTPTTQGVQDLLWAVFMLPEFQLVR